MEGFCRGCLIQYYEPSELLLSTEKIRRLFVYSTNIQVKNNDTFQLCKDCYMNMKLSCKFKKQCRTSDKKFKHYLSLKEAGDAFEFSSYIKNSDDTFRFPCLSGQSTPANHRTGDDDNESTCTSIRNFMTDILQGEEVPDTEARIIKEVIEEQTDLLEDSLDSHWLEDDASIGTDFRLDFSLSPFSTPRSNNQNVYTPNKQIEADLHNENSQCKKNIELPIEHDIIEVIDPNNQYTLQNKVKDQEYTLQEDILQKNTELNQDLNNDIFEDIHENVNYVTQNENDIAVQNLLESSTHDDNMQLECMYAVKVLQSEVYTTPKSVTLDINQEKDCLVNENELKNNVETSLNINERDQNKHLPNDGNCILEQNSDHGKTCNQNNIYLTIQSGNEIIIKINEKNVVKNEQNKDYLTKQMDDSCIVSIPMNHDVSNQKTNPNNDKSTKISFNDAKSPSENNLKDKEDKKEDILDILYKDEENKSFSLDDLLSSHAGYTLGPGASTPTINNILFGEKLDLDEDSNRLDKIADKLSIQSGETDILDRMLKKTVKELNINTPSPNIEIKYDLEKCYCITCDKKFKSAKAVKLHLSLLHHIKLPYKKNRDYDNKVRICNVCGETFKHFASFHKHMKKHEEPDQHCSKCNIKFSSQNKLKAHMKSHVPIQEVNNKIPSKQYVCTICGRQYYTSGNFTIHMKRHSKNFTAKCKVCDKGFYRKTDLENHYRLHTGEKPFACEYCDKSFRIKYGLIKHVKVHLDEKQFECAHCSQKFILRSNLVYHLKHSKLCLRLRSGLESRPKKSKKTYKCSYCEDTFIKINDLIRHQKNYKPCKTKHNDPEYAINSRKVELPILYVSGQEDKEESEDVDTLKV